MTFRDKRLDHDASDRKVILPTFTPRMKEANKFAGASVQGPDVAANNVIDLMRRVRIVLMQEAVLASVACTFCDRPPQLLAYVTGQVACAVEPEPSP